MTYKNIFKTLGNKILSGSIIQAAQCKTLGCSLADKKKKISRYIVVTFVMANAYILDKLNHLRKTDLLCPRN